MYKVIADAKAALEAKRARAKAKAKGKSIAKAKGKPKVADGEDEEDEGEDDGEESEEESEELDVKKSPAAAAAKGSIADAKKRPAAAEGSIADAKKRPAAAAEGSADDDEMDWKRFCKQIRAKDGLEEMFTAKEAKKDDNRNRYASRAYSKFPRSPKFNKIKKYCFKRAAEAWDQAHK